MKKASKRRSKKVSTRRRARTTAHRHTRARAVARVKSAADILPPAPVDQQARTALAQAAFLREFAKRGIVRRACHAAKVGRRTVYDWRESDERFKALYAEAEHDASDLLEEEAHRRAYEGVLEPVFQGGDLVGHVRRYSDRLLELLNRAHKPERFGKRLEHTGKGGGPIQTQDVPVDPKDLSEEEIAVIERVLERQAAAKKSNG